jgi:hypothetical protein
MVRKNLPLPWLHQPTVPHFYLIHFYPRPRYYLYLLFPFTWTIRTHDMPLVILPPPPHHEKRIPPSVTGSERHPPHPRHRPHSPAVGTIGSAQSRILPPPPHRERKIHRPSEAQSAIPSTRAASPTEPLLVGHAADPGRASDPNHATSDLLLRPSSAPPIQGKQQITPRPPTFRATADIRVSQQVRCPMDWIGSIPLPPPISP